MRFETKIAIAVRDNLAAWQKLNVVAFLASGIAAKNVSIVGADYEDATGNRYLPMFGQPVLCFAGSGEALERARARALDRNLLTGVYSEGMFSTGNDVDNRAVVKALEAHDLGLVGVSVFGQRKDVDKAFKGLALHT